MSDIEQHQHLSYYVEILPCKDCERGIVMGPLHNVCKVCGGTGYTTSEAVPDELRNLA